MDDVSSIVIGIGALSDDTLDAFVNEQTKYPLNFKDLTDALREDHFSGRSDYHVFWLASTLATAIIKLAALERTERS